MIVRELEVTNELGLHARVASRITRLCQNFESGVEAVKDGRRYNLKNVLSVMVLNVKFSEKLMVEFDGGDEEEAAKALEALFADKFGEK